MNSRLYSQGRVKCFSDRSCNYGKGCLFSERKLACNLVKSRAVMELLFVGCKVRLGRKTCFC